MKNRELLDQELAEYVISVLEFDLEIRGEASILVSGGSTPLNLFKILSHYEIAWESVNVILVDERFVPDQHPDQNGSMVKANLLKNNAAKARFQSMVLNPTDSKNNLSLVRSQMQLIKRPFSIVILGMGGDGHTASLFPNAPELDEGMSFNTNDDIIITHPTEAPHERITFTRKALLNTHHLTLHCYGKEKKNILDTVNSLSDYRPYPIEGFVHQELVDLKVFWTE